ncbi:MAG TPA: Ig-like domain-containing protein, partial [Mycobacterium sp.]|nr:Ig-like domain-containing protein [Mycobacterium sp.]
MQNADGTFTYTPDADFNGTDSFTYAATDADGRFHLHGLGGLLRGGGHTDTATVTITVTPVDGAPRLIADPISLDGRPEVFGAVPIGDGTRAYQVTTVVDDATGASSTLVAIVNSADGTLVRDPVTVDGDTFFTTLPLLNADGTRLYVVTDVYDPATDKHSTRVAVIDTADGTFVADPVTIAGQPSPGNTELS